MIRRRLVLALLAGAAGGCTLAPASPPIATYDFGVPVPPQRNPRIAAALAVEDVSAPAWLHSSAIVYRLAYRDSAQLQPYSRSRWAASPATLVAQRLRVVLTEHADRGVSAAADGVRSDYLLRVELDDFVQIVDSPSAARGVLRARASLVEAGERRLRAQRTFVVEKAAPSVDAAGAVQALGSAADRFIAELVEWTAREAQAAK